MVLLKKKKILNLDYKEVTKDERKVKYYYTSVENKLLSIRNSLTELHNDVEAGKFRSDNITVYPAEKPTRGKRK